MRLVSTATRCLLPVSTLLVPLTAQSPSHAESRPAIVLTLSRDEASSECLDTEALVDAVNARMGLRALVAADYAGAKDRISLHIRRTDAGFSASFEGTGRVSGHREVQASEPSCSSLGEAIAVTLSVMIGMPSEEPLPVKPVEKPLPPPKATQPPTHGEVALGWLESLELPKDASPGLMLDASYRRGWWSLGAGALHIPSRSVSYSTGHVAIRHSGLLLKACGVLHLPARLQSRLCVVPIVGLVAAEGHGYSVDRSVSRPWLSAGAGIELAGPVAWRLGWRAHVTGLGPLHRERFVVDRGGTAYEPRSITWIAGLAVTMSIF